MMLLNKMDIRPKTDTRVAMSSDQPRFLNLVDILHTHKSHPDVIAEAILQDGIWSMEPDGTMLSEHKTESEYVLDALIVVDQFVEIYLGVEFWYSNNLREFADDQCVRIYGWPEDKCPAFMEIKLWLHPPLLTLDRILFQQRKKFQLDYVDLAVQVERHGIYAYGEYPSVVKHSSNSQAAQYALSAISAYMADSNSDNPRHELYAPEDDPFTMYGWPTADFPEFSPLSPSVRTDWVEPYHSIDFKTRKSFFKEDLYTVGRILATRKATPAVIQTAIEELGVYGYDKTGRPVFHEPSHGDYMKKMGTESLESALGRFARPLLQHGGIEYELFREDTFALFGWPPDKLPDFEELDDALRTTDPKERSLSLTTPKTVETNPSITQLPVTPAAQLQLSGTQLGSGGAVVSKFSPVPDGAREGYDFLILALLAFINGEYGPKSGKDPYTKQDDLIDTILVHMGNPYGLGRTSIKKKLGAANKLRPKVGLPPLTSANRSEHLRLEHERLNQNPRELFAYSDEDEAESPAQTAGPHPPL